MMKPLKWVAAVAAMAAVAATFTPGARGAGLDPDGGYRVRAGYQLAQADATEPPPPPPPTAVADEPTTSEAAAAWQRGASQVFGKEVDERGGPSLLDNIQAVKRLLSEEPEYIYRPESLRNPMVIPWRRLEVIGYQLLETGQQLMDKSQYDSALSIFRRITQEMPGTEVAKTALRNIEVCEERRRRESGDPTALIVPQKQERPFPMEIEAGVRGIVWSERPQVLIDEEIVSVGETVPGHEDVTLQGVSKREVTFQFDNREHRVPLDASMPEIKGVRILKDARR